jgi:NAD(P)-dependent dehydrogenase (short-subunit alcohol dehydrogenase family)
MTQTWTAGNIPDLTGKIVVVTGANSGIGYEEARALAGKKATVILACRNEEKGRAAAARIVAEHPQAWVELMRVNLSDLASVRRFAGEFAARFERLDILINNAGIMAVPPGKTADGFELQFGTNHLGHFALTGLLIGRILHTPRARIVTVSSGGHRFAAMDFGNLNAEKGYDPQRAYAQSKLANLLFTYELQRRLESAGADAISTAAHPGWTATNLGPDWRMVRLISKLIAQEAAMGALPELYAATAPEVHGGDYYGPGGFQEIRGYPVKVQSSNKSADRDAAFKLWKASEEMTGVRFLDSPPFP